MSADTIVPPLKRCSKCGNEYPATREYFSPDKKAPDGLKYRCKSCRAATENASYHSRLAEDPDWARARAEQNYHRQKLLFVEQPELHERKKARGREYEAKKRQAPDFNEKRRQKRNLKRENERRAERRATDPNYRERENRNMRQRRRAHRDEWRILSRVHAGRRRVRIENGGGHYSAADVRVQYASQKGKCWWCGKKVDDKYHIDHLIPLARGGTNKPENIVISCPECNMSKHDKLPQEWNGRLL